MDKAVVGEALAVWVAAVDAPPVWAEISAFRLSLEKSWLGPCRLASTDEVSDPADVKPASPASVEPVAVCPAEEVAWALWADVRAAD